MPEEVTSINNAMSMLAEGLLTNQGRENETIKNVLFHNCEYGFIQLFNNS